MERADRWHGTPLPEGFNWSRLPVRRSAEEVKRLGKVSDPHHEPLRSQGGRDSDTIPLCADHHQLGRFGTRARHAYGQASDFYGPFGIDVEAVKTEMRRRVAREATT
jgi:hypothetical protein